MVRPFVVSFATFALVTLSAGMLSAQEATPAPMKPAPDSGTFHHRVLWIENPQSEAVLSWTTRQAGTNHRIFWDTVSRQGDVAAYANQQSTFKDGQFTMTARDEAWVKPAYFHHVHLSGLEPDTVYYVVFASDGDTSAEFHFRTAPAEDKTVAVLFGGDSRIGGADPYDHNDRQKMNMRMRTLFEESDDIYAFVHGGDYCQVAQWRFLEPWLTDHELTTTTSGRLLPVIPARGNHDRDIGFEEMFSWPTLTTNYYYRTSLTPEVLLVTLNTEMSLGGDQRDWLEATLAAERTAHRWAVVSYHRPAYSSVRSVQDGAGRRDNWVPYFERNNVDLVLESHDHALKRTLPIRSGAPDLEKGIVYIGDGGLGVPQRTPDPTRWWLQEPGFAKPVHHCHVLRFGAEGLHVVAYGMEGDTLDDFTRAPRTVAAGE